MNMWTSRPSGERSFFILYIFHFVVLIYKYSSIVQNGKKKNAATAHINPAPLFVSLGFSQERGMWTASLRTAALSHGSAVTQNLLIFMLWGQWEFIIQYFTDHELVYIVLSLALLTFNMVTRFMTLVFKNWTWVLKLSSTWTRPKSSCGWKLWRGACTQKPSTRGWVKTENLITGLVIQFPVLLSKCQSVKTLNPYCSWWSEQHLLGFSLWSV